MDPAEWATSVGKYRAQNRSDAEIREIAAYLERRGPRKPRSEDKRTSSVMLRSDYVPADQEDQYLLRNDAGEPQLKLVGAGDRLTIWSPVNRGGLINPKSTGLRRFGLVATYARGDQYYAKAFRAADLSPGGQVELRRQPDNPHDKNAVALHAPGAAALFGFVQR